eukprot:CAMPEP_0114267772 /NCGR_PEP_ID=MMETSP0058-20121206/25525_1 /TAXON_ID=36894 /ORGANISM="Pyramimonas parkeae, CCMP726" /LENGTH=320 /DNA_ID=CAMNT_0001385749 /DNA_START=63 /DNA_END=1027 /DNA_ORIENTATION=+
MRLAVHDMLLLLVYTTSLDEQVVSHGARGHFIACAGVGSFLLRVGCGFDLRGEEGGPAGWYHAPEKPAQPPTETAPEPQEPGAVLEPHMSRRIENLVLMRETNSAGARQMHAKMEKASRMAARKVAGLRDAWNHKRVVEQRMDAEAEQTRAELRERGRGHARKVEAVQARRFRRRMRDMHHSRLLQQRNHETLLFREVFLTAVEREKEKILQDRAAEREGLSELERREMLRQQQVERWYRDQCEALERTVQIERFERRLDQKEYDLEVKTMRRERSQAIESDRQFLLDRIDHQERADYFRKMSISNFSGGLLRDVSHVIA